MGADDLKTVLGGIHMREADSKSGDRWIVVELILKVSDTAMFVPILFAAASAPLAERLAC